MRNLTSTMLEMVYAQETGEVFVCTIEMTHPDWPSPTRFINDTQSLIHNGDIYEAYAFDMQLPDDEDEGFPVLKWTSDNVSGEAIAQLRSTTGAIDCVVKWVLVSDPNVTQLGPFNVQLHGVKYDDSVITGVLTLEPILDESYGFMTMTPSNSPGLF